MNLTTIDWENGTGLAFDALVVESPTYEADVPTAPTESGYVAFDCVVKSVKLRLEVMVSDIGLYGDNEPGRVEAVKNKLLMLQRNGTLLTVTTDGGIWDAMVLQSVSWSRTGSPETQRLSLAFTQVRLSTASVVAGAPTSGKRAKKLADEAKSKKEDAQKGGTKRKSLAVQGWLKLGGT